MRYTTKELEEIRKYNYPVVNDENGKLISNKYSWKDSLDKWTAGIPMRLAELINLSERMECSMEEKIWIEDQIEKRSKAIVAKTQSWINDKKEERR